MKEILKTGTVVFFIGTTAELIKVFTIIQNLKKRDIPFKIISSGQNNFQNSDIVRKTGFLPDLQLSDEDSIKKNAVGLFSWFFRTLLTSKKKILKAFQDVDFEKSVMVVHGDTISTVMGAILAKRLHMKLAHVEAGLRSGNFLVPFPEEIDRTIVNYLADYSFASSAWAAQNLEKYKGEIINTYANTITDALDFSWSVPVDNEEVKEIIKEKYAIFINHRQENLMNKKLVKEIVNQAIETSKTKKVVYILHKITEDTLVRMGLLGQLQHCENIILLRRVEYFDFMKLLWHADFIITDGGSNQEELYHMGKPALIVRKTTERQEGLNHNAILYNGSLDEISNFVINYHKFTKEKVIPEHSPSNIIANTLGWIIAENA